MPGNNNQKEYIDIPLSIEDTPLHLFQRFTPFTLPAEPIDIGFDFITRIDGAIRSPDSSSELLSLYLNYYEPVNSTHFAERDWPAVHEIETKYEDKDFNAKVQSLYNELRMRNRFDRAKGGASEGFLDAAEQSWDNYESILQRESKEISFPPIVAWQIIENFLYQFGKYHQLALLVGDQSKITKYVFNLQKCKQLLGTLSGFVPADQGRSATTSKQNFGYFALLARATLEVYSQNYKAGLGIISKISLESLSVYSRSIGALLSLFLTASYAYFMLEQYKQSARLAEMVLLFFQKNKKYFTGVNGERVTTRQFQKLAGLLCLDYIFLEERPKTLMLEVFKSTLIKVKDKQHREKLSDKYAKLRQNDQGTFLKLFQYCALPSITANGAQISELVLGRFKRIQNLTLNSILQHYTQISLAKVARMLSVSEAEVTEQIESFNNISTGAAAWDRTIMEPLLSQTRKVYVEVTDGIVKLDTDETNANEGESEWEQYRKEISWLVEKVNQL